jgi:hypothetical protein
VEFEPNRVWTAVYNHDENKPPDLPCTPVHGYGWFAEDYMHDWNWRKGMLDYSSRVSDGPVWVLLEYTAPLDI